MLSIKSNNWVGNKIIEMIFILLVPFWCLLLVYVLPNSIVSTQEMPEYMWLFLVVFIDVAHVYSTIYRTYIDKELVYKYKNLFLGMPVLLFVLSVLLHSISTDLFWRCLAYMAVFHFVRQQYGIFKIYGRKDILSKSKQIIDVVTIYSATLLPVLFWHFSSDRSFNWFVKNDFVLLYSNDFILKIIKYLFWLMILVYGISELNYSVKTKLFNIQKNLVLIGTAFSWYFGIIYFNNDIIFSLLNIICHGIPYMALVWIHGKRSSETSTKQFLKMLYGRFSLIFFLVPLLLLAYFEEDLWDTFVWKDHQEVFLFSSKIDLITTKSLLNIIVPLLTLPQLFHYVIDGYIWKIKNDKFNWTKIL